MKIANNNHVLAYFMKFDGVTCQKSIERCAEFDNWQMVASSVTFLALLGLQYNIQKAEAEYQVSRREGRNKVKNKDSPSIGYRRRPTMSATFETPTYHERKTCNDPSGQEANAKAYQFAA